MSAPDPADLRDSVADYRNPNTTDGERADIKAYWAEHGIHGQTQAILRASKET